MAPERNTTFLPEFEPRMMLTPYRQRSPPCLLRVTQAGTGRRNSLAAIARD
jgi:hypothetical protein